MEEFGLILALHVGTDEPFMKKAARMGVGKPLSTPRYARCNEGWRTSFGERSPSATPAALCTGGGRYWVGGLSAAVDGSLVGRSSSLDGAQSR